MNTSRFENRFYCANCLWIELCISPESGAKWWIVDPIDRRDSDGCMGTIEGRNKVVKSGEYPFLKGIRKRLAIMRIDIITQKSYTLTKDEATPYRQTVSRSSLFIKHSEVPFCRYYNTDGHFPQFAFSTK